MTEQIIAAVEARTGIGMRDISSRRSNKTIANARAVYSYAMYELTALSLPEIGREIGRHHTTILLGARRVRNNPELLAVAESVTAEVERKEIPMSLILDNVIHECMAKPGVPGPANKATAYLYAPVPEGVDASHLWIEVGGNQVRRDKGRDVFLYRAGDKPGTWELLADITESYFTEHFDY